MYHLSTLRVNPFNTLIYTLKVLLTYTVYTINNRGYNTGVLKLNLSNNDIVFIIITTSINEVKVSVIKKRDIKKHVKVYY